MSVWYIDGPENLETKIFLNKYTLKLDNILQDPKASVIITDRPGCSTQVARYLSIAGYRNCTVYHIGDTPLHKI